MKRVTLAGICLSLFVTAPARAVCSAANQFNFDFASQAAATLAYGSSYIYTATSSALGTQTFSVGFTQNGLSSTTVGGEVRPNISASHNGGGTNRALVVGGVLPSRTADITSGTRVMITTLTFPTAVRDVTFTVHDVDFGADQFRDWLMISGFGAATYTAGHATPFGTNNGAGPYATALSSLNLGPVTTPFAITARQAVGVSVSDNNSTTGNITVSFAQPVTSVQLRYGNHPLTGTETATGQQAFAISAVSWCPVPSLTILKSSTAFSTVATDINRFNIPGADIIYTLTVANTNSSPVDTGSMIVGDPLPAAMTFYNGDVDDAGPLTTNYEFLPGTSGLTFAPANLSYSNNGGATYAYSPAAGYDTLINALRFAPVGSMAANSSFSLRFRTRIK